MAKMRETATAPPEGSVDFLLLLSRIEAWVLKAAAERPAESTSDLEEADYVDISRAKVVAYEQSLLERLAQWTELDKVAAERYRIRIEELGPTLQSTFDASAAAARKAALPEPIEAAMPTTAGIVDAPAAPDTEAARRQEAGTAAARPQEGTGGLESLSDRRASDELSPSGLPDVPTSAQQNAERRAVADPPWREKGRQTAPTSNMRAAYETEMLDITDNMKGLAQSWTHSLQKDQKALEEIAKSQDRSQDRTADANKTGKAMIWTGQLSFIKTMIMLATSVVIFFMLIPFIIIT